MTTSFETFMKYRLWLLHISNFLGISICIYFMLNKHNYGISLNILTSLFPETVTKINNALQFTGTFILIIPLSVIISTYIVPQSLTLRIFSALFGVGSTLLIISSGYLKGTINEMYNMKLFLITKILSLEEKRILFVNEIKHLAESKYQDNLEAYDFMMQLVQDVHFTTYDLKLNKLNTVYEILAYAKTMFHDAVIQFSVIQIECNSAAQQIIVTEGFKYKDHLTTVLWVGVAILVTFTAYRLFTETDCIKTVGGFLSKITKGNIQNVEATGRTQQAVGDLAKDVNELAEVVKDVPNTVKLVSEATKDAFENVSNKVCDIEAKTLENTKELHSILKTLAKLTEIMINKQ